MRFTFLHLFALASFILPTLATISVDCTGSNMHPDMITTCESACSCDQNNSALSCPAWYPTCNSASCRCRVDSGFFDGSNVRPQAGKPAKPAKPAKPNVKEHKAQKGGHKIRRRGGRRLMEEMEGY